MNFTSVPELSKRTAADVLVIPFWQGKTKADAAAAVSPIKAQSLGPIASGDFKGKAGECALVYPSGEKEKRFLLVGLGEKAKCTVESLRRAYSAVAKRCHGGKFKKLNLILPKALSEEEAAQGVADGLLLPNYNFDRYKQVCLNGEAPVLIDTVRLIGASRKAIAKAKHSATVCEGVYFARDLVNGNADEVNPEYFCDVARKLSTKFSKVKAKIFDRKALVKNKMGLILAVGQGAEFDPALIILEYKGDPKSKEHTAVVGKGVTFDTGGLNLKPTGSIETMKCDMGGAAAAFGTLFAAASLGLKLNLTAVIPTVENSVDSRSYKVGDVYTSYLGKSVEIGNTDAEGRLILADALAYTQKKLKPKRIIDLATLTGACVIALGEEATGLMSNDDKLAAAITASGERTFERCWRLPIFDEYREKLKSDIADLKNTGGRAGGTITAAMFLKEFIGDTPWAHLDIAATAYLDKPMRYQPKNATGVGVRLLVDYLENL